MKSQEIQLDILFYHRQGLSCRQIALKLGCDPRTIKKYINEPDRAGKPRQTTQRICKLDPFKDQIAQYLNEDSQYRASWVYDRLRSCGYTGGYELVKRAVRAQKQSRQQLAYVRFETEPGQQAQVDFGDFQVQNSDGTYTTYYLFSMILGYSRMLYAQLLPKCDLPHFLQAHQQAFAALGGVPCEVLYDRMRNVFLRELAGKAEFTQSLTTLAAHYGFTPRVAPSYAPWVKGKVERPFDFIREGFWRGYTFTEITAANRDLTQWLMQKAERIHGTTHERVDERFVREKPHLLASPPYPCDVSERLYREVRKDCTVRVDGSSYVVAHTLVGRKVLVRRDEGHLRFYADEELIVKYETSKSKGALVQDPRFYAALRADRELQARKFDLQTKDGRRSKKGRAKKYTTISPTKPQFPIDVQARHTVEVETRRIDVYAQLSGEVAYA